MSSWRCTRGILTLCTVLFVIPCVAYANLSYDDVTFHFHGEDTLAYAGSSIGSIGDVNGDKIDDVYIRVNSPEPGCWVFYGGNPVDTIADIWLPNVSKLQSIDVTGDGIDDLVGRYLANPYPPWAGRVYFYRGYGDSIGISPFDSIFPETELWGAYEVNWGFAYDFDIAYVDGDGLGDLVTFKREVLDGPILYYYGGAPTLDTIADWVYASPHRYFNMNDCGFIDYDGDAQLDIFAGMKSGQQDTLSYVYIFLGPDFGTSPDYIIGQPADIITPDHRTFASKVANVGDLNSDGFDDLGVINYNHPLVYFGGPLADTLNDLHIDGVGWNLSAAGDVNGDGYDDLLVGDGYTAFGICALYLGGPRLDNVMDDYLVRGHLPPLFIDQIGIRLAPAGDFNGDGIDDFMFSSQNFSSGEPGDVWVVKGSRDIVVPVEEDDPDELPQSTVLLQNYPNPFNPSTTIEFTLYRPAHTTLTIYNILGRQIEVMVDEDLPIGTHKYTWDGIVSGERRVASGIYLYKLNAESLSEVKKMILLK